MAIYGAQGSIGAWCTWRPYNGSTDDSYNIASVTDHGQGDWTFNIDNNFSNANYVVLATATSGNGRHPVIKTNNYNDTEGNQSFSGYNAGSCRMVLISTGLGHKDCTLYNVAFIGDR